MNLPKEGGLGEGLWLLLSWMSKQCPSFLLLVNPRGKSGKGITIRYERGDLWCNREDFDQHSADEVSEGIICCPEFVFPCFDMCVLRSILFFLD